MNDFNDTTAILMAGGQSRRMGSDKRFLEIQGESLLRRSLGILEEHFKRIIISANDPANLKSLGYPVIRDEWPDKGPIAGLASSLAAMQTDWAFVVAVDIPDINIDMIEEMAALRQGVVAVVPRGENQQLEPLFAFYHRSIGLKARRAIQSGELALHRFVRELPVAYLDLESGIEPGNLNEPGDVERFLRR